MSRVVESYGYVEYGASLLEETALYRAKSGEEIVNEQTYSFTDRGGRDVTIRPEMTPSVARMVARRRKELAFPLRWYSNPNLFRYERPQRGRVREHWQLNVDMFGVESVAADIEIISVAHNIMHAFGAKKGNFEIKINDRRITNFLLTSYLNINKKQVYKPSMLRKVINLIKNLFYRPSPHLVTLHVHQLSKLIDRKGKMSQEDFVEQAQDVLGDKTETFVNFLNNKDIDNLPEEFTENEGVITVKKLLKDLNEIGITNVVYDPTIMRGFDYYTGMVFEIFDTGSENNRSLFGGGRYDNLVGIFDVEKVCGVGFGMGDVTIQDYLETYDLIPKDLKSSTDIYICVFASEYEKDANMLARYLRENGVSVAVDITNRKIPAQIKTADKKNISFIICIGGDEVVSGRYKLKELSLREEREVDKDGIVQVILENKKER